MSRAAPREQNVGYLSCSKWASTPVLRAGNENAGGACSDTDSHKEIDSSGRNSTAARFAAVDSSSSAARGAVNGPTSGDLRMGTDGERLAMGRYLFPCAPCVYRDCADTDPAIRVRQEHRAEPSPR